MSGRAPRQGHSEAALRFGTDAPYADALRYERAYRHRTADVRFYVGAAARWSQRKPVLELGAGGGRVSIALARAGHEVVAVDRMEPMLERLSERLGREPRAVRERVRVRRADLSRLRLEEKVALAIAPFNVMMHFYQRPEIERALGRVREHLLPRGRFAFDVLMPDLRALVRDPSRSYVARPVRDPHSGRRYRYTEVFQYEPVSQVQMVTAALRAEDDPNDVRIMPLAHRHFFPAELEALLHYNGFEIEERFGDFDGGPLHLECESQVIVARVRKR